MTEVYEPSPEEIAEACEQIQATWSAVERAGRKRGIFRRVQIDGETIEQRARVEMEIRLLKIRKANDET